MSGSDWCIPRNETAQPSLFPKQNHNVLSPNFHFHVSVSYLHILMIGLPILLQPNRQTDLVHECRNWERGRAVSFLGTKKRIFGTVWTKQKGCMMLLHPISKPWKSITFIQKSLFSQWFFVPVASGRTSNNIFLLCFCLIKNLFIVWYRLSFIICIHQVFP